MVSGYSWDKSSGWYERQWNKWTLPFKNTNQKYIYSLGNHDHQGDLSAQEIIKLDRLNNELSVHNNDLKDSFRIPILRQGKEVF